MSVTYAKGFRAAGIVAGLKESGKPDMALIVNDGPSSAVSAVFTSNRVYAAPVKYSREALAASGGKARAVLVNSGSANACTGAEGYAQSAECAVATAMELGIDAQNEVLICSTGKIGVLLNMQKMLDGIPKAAKELSQTDEAGIQASNAIITTDTVAKRAEFELLTANGAVRIGGMVKGAGMIAPGMATMICIITTDANLTSDQLNAALHSAVDHSFNRIDADGCMSTNDTTILMASGASTITPDTSEFTDALTIVCQSLARQIIADVEGASHDVQIVVQNATTEAAALEVARSVSRSNLLKCALAGGDPNWGRVLANIGVVPEVVAPFDPDMTDVTMNGVKVCKNGGIGDSVEGLNLNVSREIIIEIDLKAGTETADLWTSDLTYEYVNINSEYST